MSNSKVRGSIFSLFRRRERPDGTNVEDADPPDKSGKAPWTEAVEEDDPLFEGGHPDDAIIIILGPTGVGKSTFINEYFGKEVTHVSDGMVSCTQQISYHPHILSDSHPTSPGRRLVLIDTPGFDDTYNTEYETFRRICVSLASTYDNQLRVASVLYLNSVTQKRMFGSMRLDYELFRELCGKQAAHLVTMATTHWDTAELESPHIGNARENEFKTRFWKDILDAGATLERVQDYTVDPERIVDEILRKAQEKELKTMELQIQQELVDKWKRLPETEAGKKLRWTLEQFEDRLKEVEANPEKQRQKMKEVKEQLDALEVPWKDRVRDVFRFSKKGGSSKRIETMESNSSTLN
ncbi:hypothetical protein NMY22_g16738 [Coprinellus aureogranulatus]|nr:hypothetical protein NMY22_g16738 [Coprinellus aureogranulatus]